MDRRRFLLTSRKTRPSSFGSR